jgi:hypothetical protein
MIVRLVARALGAAVIACVAFVQGAQAQQQQQTPRATVAAVSLSEQLLELKGGLTAFDAAIDGVIIHHRSILLQINPNLTKDIDATVALLRADFAARRQELHHEVAVGFATVYSEQDLRDMIVFYKTPLGRKIIEGEPKAGEAVATRAQTWVEKYADDTMTKMRAEMKKRGHNEF